MAKLFLPDAERLGALGFTRIANVPVLFDGQHRYCREHNRYLRERAIGIWNPKSREDPFGGSELPRPNTVLGIARNLCVFVDWCEQNDRDWKTLSYEHGLLDYQNDMHHGFWSLSGRKLSANTANLRADEATSFLTWAASRNLRDRFWVSYRSTLRPIHTGQSSAPLLVKSRTRTGRLKPSAASPTLVSALPRAEEVREWLSAVRTQRGYAKYLACRVVLEAGLRRNEVVSLMEAQIPSASTLADLAARAEFTAEIHLTVTKGGRPRSVPLSLPFLNLLRQWIDGPRLRLRRDWSRRNANKQASRHLFLSDAKQSPGTPISDETLYRCFKVKPHPRKWHPHFGRHAYACFTIMHRLEHDARVAGRSFDALGADWIHSRGLFHLRTLQRHLGHLSETTTELYLRWLITTAGIPEIAASWHNFLCGEISEGASS